MKKQLLYSLFITAMALNISAEMQKDGTEGDLYFQEVPKEVTEAPAWWTEAHENRDGRLAWWEDARYGCFVHWGPSSVLGGVWKGKVSPGYSEHIQRKEKIFQAEYRSEVVEKFDAPDFNADEWIKLVRDAGMRYFVITAKHHDGFAMFDSDVSEWNIVDAAPFGRDPMAELKTACDKYGVKFGFYFSHAFDWGHPDGPGNDWEWKNPGGDKLLGGSKWWNDPVVGKELPRIYNEYVLKSAIPQMIELVEKYEPAMIWFDTPHKLPNSINYEIMHELRKADPEIIINGRMIYGKGDYITTCDMPLVYPPVADRYWEGVPTTNKSYGWSKHDKAHKSPTQLTQLLISAVARGGNMLMNIGPTGDGAIDEPDVHILKGIAGWMARNSETIHGCGRTILPVQAWGESTRNENKLYLQVFNWPTNGVLEVGDLSIDPTTAVLFGTPDTPLTFERLNERTLKIAIPENAANEISSVIELTFKEGELDKAEKTGRRLLATSQENHLGTFDSKLSGNVKYASGSDWRDEVALKKWNGQDDTATWSLYLNEPCTYTVSIQYFGEEAKDPANSYQLVAGDSVLTATVQTGEKYTKLTDELGELTLPAGEVELVLKAKGELNGDLFRPCWVKLTPVK